jgi:hypothetical protein
VTNAGNQPPNETGTYTYLEELEELEEQAGGAFASTPEEVNSRGADPDISAETNPDVPAKRGVTTPVTE